MEKKGATNRYIEMILDMYNGAMITMRTAVGETNDFPITIGLHQEFALSSYLFVLVIVELTRHMQDKIPWCTLFADDIILMVETKVVVNAKIELWREALE